MDGDQSRRSELDGVFDHLDQLFAQVAAAPDPIAAMRNAARRYPDVGPPPSLEGVNFTAVDQDGVRGEWVTADHSLPDVRLVYLHGGGWSANSPIEYRGFSAHLARSTRATIFMADYRLAPEHPFPAALIDSRAALEWVARNGPAGARPAKSLALAGDSAGANLAAAVCAAAIQDSTTVPNRLALIGPALDAVHDPLRVGRRDSIVTPESIAGAFETYIAGAVDPADPRVSPLRTKDDVLAKFPPTLIQVSGAEGWIFDARAFAQRLEEVEVRVLLSIWPRMPHVWHVFLTALPEASEAIREIGWFIDPQIDR